MCCHRWTEIEKRAEHSTPVKNDEKFFIKNADTRRFLWYDSDSMDEPAVGMRMQRRRLPLGLLLHLAMSCSKAGEYYPPRRRKEAISWKTHFPGVANVVKVIWFRFRISVARELPSSTRPGSALIPLACTTLRSVTAISSLMNLLATGHFIRIAAVVSKFV